MNAELVAVGTELLLGEIANTDGQYISRCLSEAGINLYYHTVVGDNPERLAGVLDLAKSRSDLIITTGGLGPTYDDLTKESLCTSFHRNLVMHEPSLERIKRYFAQIGRVMTQNNEKQALLPEGCTVLQNDWGTAPGCLFEADGVTVIMLPGPPRECEPMMRERVMPLLAGKTGLCLVSNCIYIAGMGESTVESRLRAMMESAENPTIAPYAKEGTVMLRVTARAESREAGLAMNRPVIAKIREELGDVIFSVDIPTLEETVVRLLAEKKQTFAAAESCTGGLLSKRITDIPGASAVYRGGVCSYANDVKTALLGVCPADLEKYGAVSPSVAIQMARGVCSTAGSDIGVGITGFAGPDGGTPEKPLGLVYVGLCRHGVTYVRKLTLGGNGRDRVRNSAANQALDMVRRLLERL